MRDIPGYKGLYTVDCDGNIFDVRRNRFLRHHIGMDGRFRVTLKTTDGRKTSVTVREIVQSVFPEK